jgi:hypothetical protein
MRGLRSLRPAFVAVVVAVVMTVAGIPRDQRIATGTVRSRDDAGR